MGLGGGLPKAGCIILFLVVSLASIIVGISGQEVSTCASKLSPPGDLGASVEFCRQVTLSDGSVYTLWYKRNNSTSPNSLSFVLSVPKDDTRWYGMGFNPSPNVMSFTNAIIFWVDRTSGEPVKDTYYITAANLLGVTADDTKLTYNSPPNVVVETDNLYLAFDVVETTPSDFANQNFVISRSGGVPSGGSSVITDQAEHEGVASVQINFETGSAVVTTVDVDGKRRTHGILNIIGWGVLLPIGAIVARYARGFDPHWFYIHAVSQIVGYGLVLAGLITGSQLLDKLPEVDADDHKALGIAVFVLATIQISAVLIRPKREAKLRRYWNWGHWWLGRAALVIGSANIFVGIHLADASRRWKIGYAVILALELLTVAILEILLWLNYAKSKDEPNLPQTAMQNRDSNGASAPAPPYETSWDDKP